MESLGGPPVTMLCRYILTLVGGWCLSCPLTCRLPLRVVTHVLGQNKMSPGKLAVLRLLCFCYLVSRGSWPKQSSFSWWHFHFL